MMQYPFTVDVLKPGTAETSRGQTQSHDMLMPDVPCSIDPVSGREGEVAHRLVGTATHTVQCRGPIDGLSVKCRLGEHPKDNAGKYKSLLEIGHVADPTRTGREYTLTVTEVVS